MFKQNLLLFSDLKSVKTLLPHCRQLWLVHRAGLLNINKGWDSWMISPSQWTGLWANSERYCRTACYSPRGCKELYITQQQQLWGLSKGDFIHSPPFLVLWWVFLPGQLRRVEFFHYCWQMTIGPCRSLFWLMSEIPDHSSPFSEASSVTGHLLAPLKSLKRSQGLVILR